MDQIIKYNGIGCFIEDFIEQAHQFGMLDEKVISNMRDRKKHHLVIQKTKLFLKMVKLN